MLSHSILSGMGILRFSRGCMLNPPSTCCLLTSSLVIRLTVVVLQCLGSGKHYLTMAQVCKSSDVSNFIILCNHNHCILLWVAINLLLCLIYSLHFMLGMYCAGALWFLVELKSTKPINWKYYKAGKAFTYLRYWTSYFSNVVSCSSSCCPSPLSSQMDSLTLEGASSPCYREVPTETVATWGRNFYVFLGESVFQEQEETQSSTEEGRQKRAYWEWTQYSAGP